MTATRRLAAILAADVVGYSRLIGADEGGTSPIHRPSSSRSISIFSMVSPISPKLYRSLAYFASWTTSPSGVRPWARY